MWPRQRSARASPRASAIGSKEAEHAVQEEAEPDTLAAPLVAHPVHAVVPVAGPDQRQPVTADREAHLDGPGAVLEQRGRLRRAFRLEVGIHLVGTERRSLDERHDLVEHADVAGHGHVAVDGVGQPQAVVGDARPHATARRRVPPVLDVALGELLGRGTQEVLARQLAPGGRERDDILELVAEAVRATGLVEGGPRP